MTEKKMIKRIIAIAVAALLIGGIVYWFVADMGVRKAYLGIPEPVQTETDGSITKKIDGYDVDITYRYEYDIEALVVHTKKYSSSDLIDKLSPIDTALAWGKVAEYNTRIDFNWSQSGRWYSWQTTGEDLSPVGGVSGVNRQSANTHLIPASSTIKDKVCKIKRGDHIRLKGYLVNVDAENSVGATFKWHSSTTRNDTGNGACEVMYVTSIEWLD